ncbi:putative Ubiquitin [Quillaja saponaria]|uniref:Ubiquitin n=1 Tax=Quillaja saponaria TaxID=32244 RepID=A0AAD7KW76_QUISA|nr:putative Ubiquitin [Quillaja saponaria]
MSSLSLKEGDHFPLKWVSSIQYLEIKEKIQKYQAIPISKQTLIFNGQILQDDRDVGNSEILQNSHVQLIVSTASSPESDKPVIKTEEQSLSPSPSPTPPSPMSKKIQLQLKILSSSKMHVPVEMDPNDTVLKLKEKIQEIEPIPINRLVLHAIGMELDDNKKSLRDYEILDHSEIDVSVRPLAGTNTAVAAVGGGGTKKLKLMVLPKCGTNKIPVEVNASDNVGELRKELQKLHQRLHFHLPQEGYFFIYKQNVMDDDRSFRWHHVGQGDTIEIFNGSVTGGS